VGPIQRYPRGFTDLLSIKGQSPPSNLGDSIIPTLDVMQFYGLSQQQSQFAQNAAIATDTNLNVSPPSDQHWLLFRFFARIVEQAAMTYVDLALTLDPNQQTVAYQAYTAPMIAGRVRRAVFIPPEPILLLPGQRIGVSSFFAGVATADLSINAVVGVLG